jgi:hypothetical protein
MGETNGHSPDMNLMPVQNPTDLFWLTELNELHDHRKSESLPKSCDVVVIGARYVGVATAYTLKEAIRGKESKLSITILKARHARSGATGRNG